MARENKSMRDDKLVYEVVEKLGVIAEYPNGWTKEVNLISWNNKEPKLDLRDWDPKHEHMSRGVTLRNEEAQKVCEVITAYFEAESKRHTA